MRVGDGDVDVVEVLVVEEEVLVVNEEVVVAMASQFLDMKSPASWRWDGAHDELTQDFTFAWKELQEQIPVRAWDLSNMKTHCRKAGFLHARSVSVHLGVHFARASVQHACYVGY